MIFLSFFAVPLIIAIGAYIWFGSKITFKEFLLQLAGQAAVVGIVCALCYGASTYDRETWNGRVASKTRDIVSCSHSYPCRCRPVSCGKNCTTIHCDICYRHSYDVDWNVHTTNRESLEINRVDDQGVVEPPRWTAVRLGEPTSLPHGYVNYIKAAPDTIFRAQGQSTEAMPEYPASYYDYYRLDHLVQVGTSVPDAAEWNRDLAELNADMGKAKQANVIVALVNRKPREWYKSLERSWIGGKKNDVVLVLGVDGDAITWVETMAWTDYAYFKVKLRDDVLSIGKLDRQAVFAAIREDLVKYFKRKPMSDFEYLAASITPTRTQYFIGLFFSILAAFGLAWLMAENDVFGDEWRQRHRSPVIQGRWMKYFHKQQDSEESANIRNGGW